ncbi:hypothetical protein BDD43_0506 [Mucilaginibacter gracilis]|uniref:Uncharacterized protein n=1 Tax=Mucilaginibacter gracilis TaxID=423350 RepID=A0A495IVQ7_9SPHI|nr:hypothetical protein [Mucilaginibacter gracilis]RKR80401.1 hypothetical protein BDD43_0506 [Mucilaginibacter gracilis]
MVDTRVRLEGKENKLYRPSKYFRYDDFDEKNIVSLKKKRIYKHLTNPYPGKTPVRINPILNSRVTFRSKHSEEDSIVYNHVLDFLGQLPEDCMRIGHFAQNSLHHSYFITPAQLFTSPKDPFDKKSSVKNYGIALIENVLKKIKAKEENLDVNYFIRSAIRQIDYLCETSALKSHSDFDDFSVVKDKFLWQLNKIQGSINAKKSSKSKRDEFAGNEDDFIFYPVFSGIEHLHKIDFQELFGVKYSNIIPLQRFDTNKGWRFIIPQKSYNERLKGKNAIVVDMGSFTGDSIIQMVDALSVFELNKITVISLIGRLEDFDREFFSKVQELKVKLLQSPEGTASVHKDEEKLAPLKIYFGVNLHIPPASSSKICEHCQEITLLNRYRQIEIFNKTPAIKYIEERLRVLELKHFSEIELQCPPYMPKTRGGAFDVETFFSVRNHLGKIDGYRFYTDYYTFFDDLKEGTEGFNEHIEAIIAVSLHEKHLWKTINNQLPDVKEKIRVYIDHIMSQKLALRQLHYNWDVVSLLKCYFLVNERDEELVFGVETQTKLFGFIVANTNDHEPGLNYISYKFAQNFHINKEVRNLSQKNFDQTPLIKSIRVLWGRIERNKNLPYHSLITHFNRKIVNAELIGGKEAVKGFFTLSRMYDEASAYYPNHSNFSVTINGLKTFINEIKNVPADIKNFKAEMEEAERNFQPLMEGITEVKTYLKSLYRFFDKNRFAEEYFNGGKKLGDYLDRINYTLGQRISVKARFDEIWNIVHELESAYFSLDDDDNFYSIWKLANYISVLDIWQGFTESNNETTQQVFSKFFARKGYGKRIQKELGQFEVSATKSYVNVGVNIHPYLLIAICKELLDNSFTHAPGSDVKVSITTETNPDSQITYSVIRYRQNQASKGEKKNGLVDVDKILDDFNGSMKFVNRPNSLLIKIAIPITQYSKV